MKTDPDVKMTSADACCVKHAKSSYPKSPPAPSSYPTLTSDAHSRSDIAAALFKSDQFDFLLDIVPQDIGGMRKREIGDGSNQGVGGGGGLQGSTEVLLAVVTVVLVTLLDLDKSDKRKREGPEGLQTFDEEGRDVDGRRMMNRSGDVLEELFWF
ncbi:hypothetical protein K435DRAFT_291351 [Dendrothele bispora CBS 962.96]|uniref:Transcription factor CBF/NF-Y/archaeal histone domain-containing protein n=1 Tax=Dendrothele bispora (strain CBS 962.96) TaxID=1314807 RepID=A0A4S8LJG7_DENBC|nr:hypothetical protein K435DRAFT_291351 [Dendrothele bispora CBS 962.96]